MASLQEITNEQLIHMTDLVNKEPNLYEQWPKVINKILVKVPVEAAMYVRLIRANDIYGGVHGSLQRWNGFGAERMDLLSVMREYGLEKAAKEIEDYLLKCSQLSTLNAGAGQVAPSSTSRSGVNMRMDSKGLSLHVTPCKAPVVGPNCYKMTSNPRGFALIINNWQFSDPDANRKGTEQDYANMKRLFRKLNYHVSGHENVKSTELEGILTEFKDSFDDLAVDSCVVCVMSHGEQDQVVMADCVKIHYWRDLIYKFDGRTFGQFKGKPKIFIIQSCRPVPGAQTPLQLQSETLKSDLSDTLVCVSTLPGMLDWQDSEKGSWYIHCLTQVVAAHAHDTEARKLFGDRTQDEMCKVRYGGVVLDEQKPSCTPHSFTKEFYFNPKEMRDD